MTVKRSNHGSDLQGPGRTRARAPRSSSLKQRFHDRIIGKIVDWVLGQRVDEGNVSSLTWDKEEHDLIYKLVDNPKAAEINVTIKDPKFRRFFKSVADNGLNTADVKMFYRYRDRLPIKQMNWAYDEQDFEFDDEGLISNDHIHAGFYMLEFQTDLPAFRSRVSLEIKTEWATERGEGSQTGWLTVSSGRIGKRLLWLEHDSIVQINTKDPQVVDHLSHLRLSRLTRTFFISRLMKKLGLRFVLSKHRDLQDATLKEWWQDYDAMFAGSYDPARAYAYQVKRVEPKAVPTSKQQIFNLSRWLK